LAALSQPGTPARKGGRSSVAPCWGSQRTPAGWPGHVPGVDRPQPDRGTSAVAARGSLSELWHAQNIPICTAGRPAGKQRSAWRLRARPKDATALTTETVTGRSDCMNMHTWPAPAMRAHAALRYVVPRVTMPRSASAHTQQATTMRRRWLAGRPQGNCPSYWTGEGLLHARLRAAFHGSWCIAARIRLARPVGRTPVPLRRLRPARARSRYRRLALPWPGHRRCRSCGRPRAGQGRQPRCIGVSGCRWLPVWLPGGGPPLQHISGSQFCLVSAYPPVHPQGDVSDWV